MSRLSSSHSSLPMSSAVLCPLAKGHEQYINSGQSLTCMTTFISKGGEFPEFFGGSYQELLWVPNNDQSLILNSTSIPSLMPLASEHTTMQYIQAKVPSVHHPTLTQPPLGIFFTVLLGAGVLTVAIRGYAGFASKLISLDLTAPCKGCIHDTMAKVQPWYQRLRNISLRDLQLAKTRQKGDSLNTYVNIEPGPGFSSLDTSERFPSLGPDTSEMQRPHLELITSIRLGMISDVHHLLCSAKNANYIEINETDSTLGMTILEYAAFMGDQYIVMLLLLYGAAVSDPDTTGKRLAPIWWALKGSSESQTGEAGCQEIIRLLLKKGADQQTIPDFPKSRKLKSPLLAPIHLAAKLGYAGVVGILLEHDCNHDGSYTGSTLAIQDSEGFSALHYAAKQGHTPVVELLLTKGANIECRDRRGNTPLQIASREGNAAAVKLLLDQGADIEAKNDDAGFTPLHCAARYREEEIVRILLSRGASTSAKDSRDRKPLHWAAQHGHDSVVGILLQHMQGCGIGGGTGGRYDINEKDNEGRTGLHLAAGDGHATVVSALLSHGADVKVTDNYLKTPLHYACTSPFGRKALVEALLDHRADVDAKDDNFKTPLHLAVAGPSPGMRSRGDVHVVKLLLERGADFEAEDAEGKRSLHLAVPLRYLPMEDPYSKLVTKLLLRKGATRQARDRSGKTAVELAREGEYWEVCRILEKRSRGTAAE